MNSIPDEDEANGWQSRMSEERGGIAWSAGSEKAIIVSVAGNPKLNRVGDQNGDLTAAGSGSQMAGNTYMQQLKYFDFNLHAMKKGVSSALLDVALLMANASQLKAVIQHGSDSKFYEVMMTLLICSITIQIVVGCVLIWLGRININEPNEKRQRQAEVLNNLVVIGIFILTVINVFTSAIGISAPPPKNATSSG